jgi:hypothetical protein
MTQIDITSKRRAKADIFKIMEEKRPLHGDINQVIKDADVALSWLFADESSPSEDIKETV